MKKILYLFALAAILLTLSAVATPAQTHFVARMDGAQETPPTGSTGTGYGTVFLNATEDQITVNMTFTGLSSAANNGHIHTGPPGVAGPVTFGFTAAVPAATSGTIATQTFAITPAQVATLRSGGMYFNVHSANFPGGEIRGQIAPLSILISEFRFRGSAGASDEFIEIYNNSDLPVTVATTDGSAGWAVAGANTNATPAISARFTIPNGTVIPARGHYLGVNSASYSLATYAAGDITFTTGIVDGGSIAVFNTATQANFTAANRFDAVGFTAPAGGTASFIEGTGLTPAAGITTNGEYSFVRRSAPSVTDGSGFSGTPQDTNDNQADFMFVSTTGGTFTTRVSSLGAPGPENLASPTFRSRTQVAPQLLVPTNSGSAAPNRAIIACGVQGAPGCPADPNTSRGDYLAIRRSFTNNSGATITRLRFRIIDVTTLNNTDGLASPADLRAVTSSDIFIAPSGFTPNVLGTTLEQPPTQTLGGGLNSSLNVVSLANLPGGGLASTSGGICPGGSTCTVGVQFILGIKTGGAFRFFVSTEATNAAATAPALTATSDETEKGNDRK